MIERESAGIQGDSGCVMRIDDDPGGMYVNTVSFAKRAIGVGMMAALGLSLASPALHVAAQDAPVTTVASGLINPRGVAFDPATGEMLVASAGVGGATAQIVKIVDGCPVVVVDGLPSAGSVDGDAIGVADVAYAGDTLYALVAGGGEAHGSPDMTSGLYRVNTDGTTELVFDLEAFISSNPVPATPVAEDFDLAGNPYSMAVSPDGASILIAEANSEQIISVDLATGEATRAIDLSAEDSVPTAVAFDVDGDIIVGTLGAGLMPGGASVYEYKADGSRTVLAEGLTTVTGVAVTPEGHVYAVQMFDGMSDPMAGPSGVLVEVSAEGVTPVATGLLLPSSVEAGPDGDLYVSTPAIGGGTGNGSVLRIDPSAATDATPIAVDAAAPAGADCAVATPAS